MRRPTARAEDATGNRQEYTYRSGLTFADSVHCSTLFVSVTPALGMLGEESWGREAHGAGENGADDGGVDEDLLRRRTSGQAEDRLHGVIRVGEGDEASERLEDTRRMLVAEEA